jgi:integrase
MSRAGSITRDSSGKWQLVVDLTPPGARKRKQIRRRGFPTKRAALEELDNLKGNVKGGSYVAPNRLTLAEWLERWLRGLPATGLRDTTIHDYGQKLAWYVLERPIADLRLQQVTAADLDALYGDLTASGKRNGEGLAAGTVRGVHLVLSRAFADAVRTDVLPRNPADKARPPAAGAAQSDLTVWSPDQTGRFLASVGGHQLVALWRVYAMTGLRRGEALGLRWSDLDLDGATLTVAQSVSPPKRKGKDGPKPEPKIGPVKTKRSRRRVDLDALTVAMLRGHRKTQLEQRMLIGAGWRDLDLVFPRVDGAPFNPEATALMFKRLGEKAGLPKVRLHDLRHGHATHLLAAGANPRMVSERLGHSSVAFTLDRYGHVLDGMQSTAAAAVAALVDGVL